MGRGGEWGRKEIGEGGERRAGHTHTHTHTHTHFIHATHCLVGSIVLQYVLGQTWVQFWLSWSWFLFNALLGIHMCIMCLMQRMWKVVNWTKWQSMFSSLPSSFYPSSALSPPSQAMARDRKARKLCVNPYISLRNLLQPNIYLHTCTYKHKLRLRPPRAHLACTIYELHAKVFGKMLLYLQLMF